MSFVPNLILFLWLSINGPPFLILGEESILFKEESAVALNFSHNSYNNETLVRNETLMTKVDESRHSDDDYSIHSSKSDLFILFSSINSIRYWSLDCPIHRSQYLFVNSTLRSYQMQNGISNIATLRTNNNETRLLWYNRQDHQFYHASIVRNIHQNDCDDMIKLENRHRLEFFDNSSDPNKFDALEMTLDDKNRLIFIANLQYNRIDIYPFDDDSLQKNSLILLKSISIEGEPRSVKNIAKYHRLFWIESQTLICQLNYQNLSALNVIRSDSLRHLFEPIALAIDSENNQILVADKKNRIWINDLDLRNNFSMLFESMISPIIELWVKNRMIFLRDHREIQLIDVQDHNHFLEKTILIESQAIFAMNLLQLDNSAQMLDEKIFDQIFYDYQTSVRWHLLLLISIFFSLLILFLVIFKCFHRFKNNLRNSSVREISYDGLESQDSLNKSKSIVDPSRFKRFAVPSSASSRNKRLTANKIRTTQHKSNDIEDLFAPIVENISNPFHDCNSCPEPKICQENALCLATYRANR
ncbi:hypothetical protein SSS_00349 [Sarcoptes scabiei]|uniref:Uncharacterized protein n=1 Tax=Sarcoptes scabiei TaxID=52283 RepID=A0A834R9M4_SARSC|nr:hypothetical protein SSS_00349 [Sarcoptes scabiei]